MHEQCVECGGDTVWEQELGSAICTSCGTLSNPSQSILASHVERDDTSGRDYSGYWNHPQGFGTLKGRNGWALAGQDQEGRRRRNQISMHEFIRSVALQLSSTGVVARAQTIFDQAMLKGSYNWGRRAKLVGGAAIAIALRESNKSEALRDIAFLIEEEFTALSRVFMDVLELLQLKLTPANPSTHLPTLQTHCQAILNQPMTLPNDLYSKLKSLATSLQSILHTGTSLSTLLSRLNILQNIPTPPTACSIFMLAMEGELGSSMPHAGALARCLGARLGVSQKVVMERYKIIYDAVEALIKDVPWLEAHKKQSGRSKVAKRAVVARGLKDVIQFQEQIWLQKMEHLTKPTLMLETDEDSNGPLPNGRSSDSQRQSCSTRRIPHDAAVEPSNKPKKSKQYQRAVGKASQFLLDPTNMSSSARTGKEDFDDVTLSRLLTADTPSLPHVYRAPPTRLQVLSFVRGGEDAIDDEELFDDGELDSFIRSSEEVQALQGTLGWDEANGAVADQSHISRKRRPPNDTDPLEGPPRRKQRIDMDALARILDPDVNLSDDIEPGEDYPQIDAAAGSFSGEEDEIVGEWRPLSPSHSGLDYDRYDS